MPPNIFLIIKHNITASFKNSGQITQAFIPHALKSDNTCSNPDSSHLELKTLGRSPHISSLYFLFLFLPACKKGIIKALVP